MAARTRGSRTPPSRSRSSIASRPRSGLIETVYHSTSSRVSQSALRAWRQLLVAARQVEVGWRRVRQPPHDELFLPAAVELVGRIDGVTEGMLESDEGLRLARAEPRPEDLK